MVYKEQLSKPLQVKFSCLREKIAGYGEVAVAFSGGIDSTVLLHNACAVLQPEHVLACHVRTCFLSSRMAGMAENVLKTHFSSCRVQKIEGEPLAVAAISSNSEKRCYHCKNYIYHTIEKKLEERSYSILDGTNADDLQQVRPGLAAARELGVKTPMAECGLTKQDIRHYGKAFGLVNASLPSDSCLATRVVQGVQINQDLLNLIEEAEVYLQDLGFLICRVRMGDGNVVIELAESEIERLISRDLRQKTVSYFVGKGLAIPSLKLSGR